MLFAIPNKFKEVYNILTNIKPHIPLLNNKGFEDFKILV
jgi:hypothetical protein